MRLHRKLYLAVLIALVSLYPLALSRIQAQVITKPDFQLTASPTNQSVVKFETAVFSLRIQSVRGFTGAVSFGIERLPDGIVTQIQPTFVSPPPGGSAYATLTVRPEAVPTNTTFNFLVFAIRAENISGGGIIDAKRFNLAITVVEAGTPDFLIGVFPAQRVITVSALQPTQVVTGVFVEPRNGFSGLVTLNLQDPPPGLSFTFEPLALSFSPGEGKKNTFVRLTLAAGFSTFTTNYLLSISGTAEVPGTTGILRSSIFQLSVSAIPDFSLIVSPAVATIQPGGTATYGITLRSVERGFGGNVVMDLRSTPRLPFDVTFTFSPQPVTVFSGAGVDSTATLRISTTPRVQPDRFDLIVAATGGGTTREQPVRLIVTPVGDFNVTTPSPNLSIGLGFIRTATVNVQSLGDFQSLVNLTIVGAPPPERGVAITVQPDFARPNPGNTVTTTLQVQTQKNAAPGTYIFSIQGRSGVLAHEQRFVLSVRQSGGCVIATATYGSELSPQVQFLRNFRDDVVLSTQLGSGFMQLFDSWYYSFSPGIAERIATDDGLREIMRLALYPSLLSLQSGARISGGTGGSPELAIIAVGLASSAILGFVYLSLPLLIISRIYSPRLLKARQTSKVLGASILVSFTMIFVGLAAGLDGVTRVGAAASVLTALVGAALVPSFLMKRHCVTT